MPEPELGEEPNASVLGAKYNQVCVWWLDGLMNMSAAICYQVDINHGSLIAWLNDDDDDL